MEIGKIRFQNKFKISDKIQMDLKRIILGTVQFGTNYGINNQRGKIPQSEAFEILNKAIGQGINTVDTAPTYGNSEQVLGNFIKSYNKKLKIVSKLPKCFYWETERVLYSSLNKLGITKIYGYLIHDFQTYRKDKRNWRELERLKTKGKIQKIGFSLYYPEELEYLFNNNIKIDIIQLPYNIFDQRFSSFLPKLKNKGVEIHVRSVFLQGLFLIKPDKLKNKFVKIKSKLEQLNIISRELSIPIPAICLNFVQLNINIDKIIIGVDSINHLKEDIKNMYYLEYTKQIIAKLEKLRENNEEIIIPLHWNRNE